MCLCVLIVGLLCISSLNFHSVELIFFIGAGLFSFGFISLMILLFSYSLETLLDKFPTQSEQFNDFNSAVVLLAVMVSNFIAGFLGRALEQTIGLPMTCLCLAVVVVTFDIIFELYQPGLF